MAEMAQFLTNENGNVDRIKTTDGTIYRIESTISMEAADAANKAADLANTAASGANASKEACDETAAKLAALFPLGIYLDAEGFICQKAKE